jgi:uncharacterized membrane protein
MPGRSLKAPGILIGLGLGGFIDGILLHQILQWHHMLSNLVPSTTLWGLEINIIWDGLFHAATWVFVVLGLALLWRAVQGPGKGWSARSLFGWTLAGWGWFNLIEGIIDHHILQVHHVRPGPNQLAYDIGFLVLGALLIWLGRTLAKSSEWTPAR